MPRRLITTGSPFEKAFGYSRAVVQDPFVFRRRHHRLRLRHHGAAGGRRRAGAELLAHHRQAALGEAGASLADIVRATYYVTDAAHAEPVLRVCGEVLAEIRPASTILIVAGLLRPEMKVEIEVTAMRQADALAKALAARLNGCRNRSPIVMPPQAGLPLREAERPSIGMARSGPA